VNRQNHQNYRGTVGCRAVVVTVSTMCLCLALHPKSLADETSTDTRVAPAQPTAQLASGSPVHSSPQVLALGLRDAVLMALEQNIGLRAERLNVDISRNNEQIERAAFDPNLTVTGAVSSDIGREEARGGTLQMGVSQSFATGTTVSVLTTFDAEHENREDQRSLGMDVAISQALLRGAGREVNLVRLHQAQLATRISAYDLRALTESLVAAVETTYWKCVLAREKIDIYERSLEVARQQIDQVRERIAIGKLAEIELAASEAEVAGKREELIVARGELAKRTLEMRRLLSRNRDFWTQQLQFLDRPGMNDDTVLDDVEVHVQLGLRYRPDLCQARLGMARGDLELARTRNGVLPQLDLFVQLGGTHYSQSFETADEDNQLAASIGLALSLPLSRREDRAVHRNATLAREQAELAVANMEQLVQLDVRSAYVAVDVAREQITATEATRKLRQDSLTAEQEKFGVGTSTTLQVAQAWRDLLASQINAVEAVVNWHIELVDLYRLEGTLLNHRGLAIDDGTDAP